MYSKPCTLVLTSVFLFFLYQFTFKLFFTHAAKQQIKFMLGNLRIFVPTHICNRTCISYSYYSMG